MANTDFHKLIFNLIDTDHRTFDAHLVLRNMTFLHYGFSFDGKSYLAARTITVSGKSVFKIIPANAKPGHVLATDTARKLFFALKAVADKAAEVTAS